MSNGEIAVLLAVVVGVAGVIGLVAWIVIKGVERFHAAAARRLEEIKGEYCVDDEDVGANEGDDLHAIRFHVYHGVFNTLGTVEINWLVPLTKAEECIQQLTRYDYRWGLFGAGAALVPFSTMYHSVRQRRLIRKRLEDRWQSPGRIPQPAASRTAVVGDPLPGLAKRAFLLVVPTLRVEVACAVTVVAVFAASTAEDPHPCRRRRWHLACHALR